MLSSSHEKSKLQALALQAEKERGKIYCEKRLLNAEARKRGEYTRYKSLDRRMYEEISRHIDIANDNRAAIDRVREGQKHIDAALSQKGRALNARQFEEWQSLFKATRREKQSIEADNLKTKTRMIDAVREAYAPQWRELYQAHESQRCKFDARERSTLGKFHNAFQSLALSGENETSGRKFSLGDIFGALTSHDARLHALEKRHETEAKKLHSEQKAKERDIACRLSETRRLKLAAARIGFLDRVRKLKTRHGREGQTLKDEWRTRHKVRRREWRDLSRKLQIKHKARSDFRSATNSKESEKERMKERIREKLRADRERGKDRGKE